MRDIIHGPSVGILAVLGTVFLGFLTAAPALAVSYDLMVTGATVPATGRVGAAAAFTAQVSVPMGATGATLTAVFQPAVKFVSGSGCTANVPSAASTVTCTAATGSISINATPLYEGTLSVAFGLAGNEADDMMSNNSTIRQMIVDGGRSDFNGDGMNDIVWQNQSTAVGSVWFMNGTIFSSLASLPTPNPTDFRYVATGDFNADGSTDIVLRKLATGDNIIWYMNGTARTSGVTLPPLSDLNWEIRGVGDFNGDGVPDILWQNKVTGQGSVWFMTAGVGTVTVTAAIPPPSDLNWQYVGVGDFNGDGKPDIVLRHAVSGEVIVWYMNGTTYMSGYSVSVNQRDLNWQIVGVGDFNADGKPDLVWRNKVTGEDSIWLVNGTTITPMAFNTQSDTNWEIRGPR